MSIKTIIVVALAAAAGIAFWQTRGDSGPGASAAASGGSTFEAARSCLESGPGFQVRESTEAKGARQLYVDTPAGRAERNGNVTITHKSSAFVTFFASEAEAEQWSDALADLGAAGGKPDPGDEMIGTAFVDWNVSAPESERAALRGCVAG
jgi:hypothetical protein